MDNPTEETPDSRWKARLERERTARKEAERLLEAKSRDLHQANQTLHAVLANLEDRVRERTRELDDARLTAERANEAKSRFLATMSHEIRTPMNGVVGMADYLASTPLSSDQARCVRAIQGAATALPRILDDILDLSRLDSNRLELAPTDFSPRELVEDTLGLFGAEADRRGLILVANPALNLPPLVTADRVRLGQILGNLVGNALKFTHQGGVTIDMEWEDDSLLIQVTDTGIGIPEETRSKLFARLSQVDASPTRTYGGSGLGLAICRDLSQVMGATITLDAPEEGGSRFTVQLPAPRPSTSPNAPIPSRPPPHPIARTLEGFSILVVDDNDINREVATRLLCKIGCAAESVSHGQAALDLLRERPFDLVFMDVRMPGLDGFETTRRIRASEGEMGRPRTPIIALTGDSREGVRETCEAAGMDCFLAKPVTRKSLFDCLTALTRGVQP
ncbi:MAG: response regulator [Rhodospirillum sp.]|nr:response regulator [Rhodospirillum sp.]